jgi:beta-lactamase regulating signal transducer with metallopeptidase domain/cell division septation protein DedD
METNSEYLLTFLLNAGWQIAIVVALAALASLLLRNGPARYRYLIWAGALLAAVMAPVFSTTNPAVTESLKLDPAIAALPDNAGRKAEPSPIPAVSTRAPAMVRFPTNVTAVVLSVYCLLLLYSAVRFFRAWLTTIAIKNAAENAAPPPCLQRVWARCARTFGVRRVYLLKSRSVASPVALGAFRAAVIIPESLWNETSEDLLTAAVGHELAHVARRDYLTNLIQELLLIPIGFHPGARYIRRQLVRTREIACDEAVTGLLLTPRVYARSIVQIATGIAQTAGPGYAVGMFEGGMLEERIRRVLRAPVFSVRRARLILAAALSCVAITVVLTSGVALTAKGQSPFQMHLKEGIAAWNAGDFRTASSHFGQAVAAEPVNSDAKLYYANSLMSEFYAQNEPDPRLRSTAMQQYTDVLARDEKNKQALAGMTTLAMETAQLREAHEWATRLAAADPGDKSAWYTLGVLDWMFVYPEYQRAKMAAGAAPESNSIPDLNIRSALRGQHLANVEEGIQVLHKVLALDAHHDAAMAYTNLLLRIKAGMTDSPAEAAGLIAQADQWIGRALEAKRQKAGNSSAAKLELGGPPPGPARRTPMSKAPPPPPPPPPPPAPGNAQKIASALPRPPAGPNQPPLVAAYWQVVGATDMPAMDLYRRLREKGFASVLHSGSDQLTRVLAGPYFDDTSAAKSRTSLEAAGFRVLRKWE